MGPHLFNFGNGNHGAKSVPYAWDASTYHGRIALVLAFSVPRQKLRSTQKRGVGSRSGGSESCMVAFRFPDLLQRSAASCPVLPALAALTATRRESTWRNIRNDTISRPRIGWSVLVCVYVFTRLVFAPLPTAVHTPGQLAPGSVNIGSERSEWGVCVGWGRAELS